MEKLEVRYIEEKDMPEIIKLYERVWRKEFSKRMKKIFYWKYFSHPFTKEKDNKSIVISKGGEIIGFSGVLPANFKLGDKIAFGYWICDYMVDPNHRGVGLKLNRKIINELPIILGQPGDVSYRIWKAMIYKKTGKKSNIARVTQRVKRMNYYYPLNRVLKIGILADFFNYLWIQCRVIKFKEKHIQGFEFRKADKFDNKFETFLKNATNTYDNIAVRDIAYLKWRFVECPYDKHHIFIAEKEEKIVGYIVIRIVEKDHKKEGFIVDVLTYKEDFQAMYFLFKSSFKYFDREKVNTVLFQDAEIASMTNFLKKIGFTYQFKSETKFTIGSVLPSQGISDDIFYNSLSWYITLGDSDFNMHY